MPDLFSPAAPDPREALRESLRIATERLIAEYDISPALYAEEVLDPLSDLVHALLGHRTRYEDNDAAWRALVDRFGPGKDTWASVRDAPVDEVAAVISRVTWPEQKAPRIQAVLRQITALRAGDLSLDFLADLPTRQARGWLERLPGVGPKTSAIVVMYSTLRKPALVIDTHHYRVSARMGWIPPGVPPERSEPYLEALLPPGWGAREYADHHLALFRHGQDRCTARAPDCPRCPVLDLCPTGRARAGP